MVGTVVTTLDLKMEALVEVGTAWMPNMMDPL